jgi:hypothetical protein
MAFLEFGAATASSCMAFLEFGAPTASSCMAFLEFGAPRVRVRVRVRVIAAGVWRANYMTISAWASRTYGAVAVVKAAACVTSNPPRFSP